MFGFEGHSNYHKARNRANSFSASDSSSSSSLLPRRFADRAGFWLAGESVSVSSNEISRVTELSFTLKRLFLDLDLESWARRSAETR